MNVKICGIADKLAHQVIDRRYQQIAPFAQSGIGALAMSAGDGEIARDGETLNEMLAVGKAEGAIHGALARWREGARIIEQTKNTIQ
jgi:hypothetical protein